jgi:hypothetical protein
MCECVHIWRSEEGTRSSADLSARATLSAHASQSGYVSERRASSCSAAQSSMMSETLRFSSSSGKSPLPAAPGLECAAPPLGACRCSQLCGGYGFGFRVWG